MTSNKLIIVGDSYFAEIAYEYFTHDSKYEVCGFAVEKEYRNKDSLFGVPAVDFEALDKHFPCDEYTVFVAVTYLKLNRVRARLVQEAKNQGYKIATYVSSKAFVWENVKLGENCFIFENNVVQPFVEIGDNSILWSGNHIGHHSKIGNHAFISSHVVISGLVNVGDYSFLGVNSTIGNEINIGADCWLEPGSIVTSNLPDKSLVKSDKSVPSKVDTYRFFRLKTEVA